MRFTVCFLLSFISSSSYGFNFPSPTIKIKEGLKEVVDSQKTTTLELKMDIGANNGRRQLGGRLNVNGLILELSSAMADYDHPLMPGVDGPQPQLSGGARTLDVLQDGWFIDMTGKRCVQTLNGCWEMVWREKALAGSLVCGFDVPVEYKRNQATLPSCRMYMSFPLWTMEGLLLAQKNKEKVVSRANAFLAEKKLEIEKMQTSTNPLISAMHYRNAAHAKDMASRQNLKHFDTVPSSFDETIPLQDDLLLTTRGLVFSKDGSFKRGKHLLLGSVHASQKRYSNNYDE